jgi:dTDP-4-dehydrorhamnose reductase
MSNFVVLGAKGVLGQNIVKLLRKSSQDVIGLSREDIDISSNEQIKQMVESNKKAIFINCVGYMPADKCESNSTISRSINVDFPSELSRAIHSSGERLIHFSSDFIFDGKQSSPYDEESLPKPLNVYGQHKFESEKNVTEILGSNVRIIRFASLIATSEKKSTFIEKVIEKAQLSPSISLVSDLRISISTPELISRVCENAFNIEKTIIHAIHNGETSWLEIAKHAFKHLNLNLEITEVDSTSFGSPAARPLYSVLRPSDEITSLGLLEWTEAMNRFMSEKY